jgi:hypothetical protein
MGLRGSIVGALALCAALALSAERASAMGGSPHARVQGVVFRLLYGIGEVAAFAAGSIGAFFLLGLLRWLSARSCAVGAGVRFWR